MNTSVADTDLDEFFVEQRDQLVRLAYLLTGSPVAAEDVVQDAFLVLYSSSREIHNLPGYARGVVVKMSQKAQRRRVVERRYSAQLAQAQVVLPPELDEAWAAVQRLRPAQRAVIVLRFYADASLNEIAEVTGKPLGTVKSLLHRALGRLSKELSP